MLEIIGAILLILLVNQGPILFALWWDGDNTKKDK
jgi:hypothetical protein